MKNVEFKEDLSAFTAYSFKPQLRTVGPKYGKHLNAIKEYLANVDGNKAMSELKADGVIKFTADDTEIALTEEDLLIDVAKMEGYVTEGDNYVTVVIDTTLTPELIEEGYVREGISKIQTMRKDAGFEVMDHIVIYCDGSDKVAEILTRNKDSISEDTLADDIVTGKTDGFTKEQDINGENVTLGVKKV